MQDILMVLSTPVCLFAITLDRRKYFQEISFEEWGLLLRTRTSGPAQNCEGKRSVSHLIFTVAPCILILSSLLFIQRNAPPDYSRLNLTLKFTLKFSYMFQLTNHHQGAYCCALLKLWLLKQSVKICRYEFSAVSWLHIYSVLIGLCAVSGAEWDWIHNNVF